MHYLQYQFGEMGKAAKAVYVNVSDVFTCVCGELHGVQIGRFCHQLL